TLLRLGDWCEHMTEDGSELAIDFALDAARNPFGLERATILLSSLKGIALILRRRDANGLDERAAFVGERGLALYATRAKVRSIWSSVAPSTRIFANIGLSVKYPPEPGDDSRFALQVGLGVSSGREEGEAPFGVRWNLAPAALVGIPGYKDNRAEAEDGILTIEAKEFAARIDEATGRPIDLAVREEGKPVVVRGRSEDGALESARERFERMDLRDDFDPSNPVVAAFVFAATRLVPLDALLPSASVAVLRKLLHRGVLAPIEEAMRAGRVPNEESFPAPRSAKALASAGPMGPVAIRLLIIADRAFPRGSWPWVLAREAAFVAAGHSEYTGAVLIQVYSAPEIGPIACAAFAGALLRAGKSKLAAAFAQRGLADLSTDAFLRDMRPFHEGDSASARIARRLCETLRDLTSDEMDALVSIFHEPDRPAAREIAKALTATVAGAGGDAKDADARAIQAALAILWEKGLRARVEAALAGLLRRATAPVD
ncbi:MAG: hypothetical protein JXP34_28605, partial [Planctomycetes bacterium]|nr:hypothetical protein [Planctomycetota bacterium]